MFIKNFGLDLFGSYTDNLSLKTSRSQMVDEVVNELVFNSLKGKKYFEAICLTEPIAIQQRSMVMNTGLYYPIRVRPTDIYNFVIPDPCSLTEPDMILRAILQHPIAFAVRPAGHGERIPTFGDTVRCHFSIAGPNNSGGIRGLRYLMPEKNHKFDYKCAKKIQKASSDMFATGRLRLLDLPDPVEPLTPKKIKRFKDEGLGLSSLDECQDKYDRCAEKLKHEIRTRLNREPTRMDMLPCDKIQLDCEERKEANSDTFMDQFYWVSRAKYYKTQGFEEWVHWNNLTGNLPKFFASSHNTGGEMRVFAQWPYQRPDDFCSGPLSVSQGQYWEIRFFNSPDRYVLPKKRSDKFSTATGGATTRVDDSYFRTMVLRALPFIIGYVYPFNKSEFAAHLDKYPELAHHWVIQTDHSCTECVEYAKSFLASRTDVDKLLEKAKDPSKGGWPDYAKYLFDSDADPPFPKTYKIKSGDYLGKISRETGVPEVDIKDWNGIHDGDVIYAGNELWIEDPADPKFKRVGHRNGIVYQAEHDKNHLPCPFGGVEYDGVED